MNPNPWLAKPPTSSLRTPWNMSSTVDAISLLLDFFSVDNLPSTYTLGQQMSNAAILGAYKSTFALKLYISSAPKSSKQTSSYPAHQIVSIPVNSAELNNSVTLLRSFPAQGVAIPRHLLVVITAFAKT